MGSCVSVHSQPESAFRFRVTMGSKNRKPLIPAAPAPVELKTQPVNPQQSRPGSKEDAFFDSQPWLDSDCDDDYVSIRGDFTPSRGSTPVHPKFSVMEGSVDSEFIDASSPDKRKRLSDLFKESLRVNQIADDAETAANENGDIAATATVEAKGSNGIVDQPKSSDRNPYPSAPRSPTHNMEDEPMKSAPCCLPRLLSTHSFNQRKANSSPLQGVR